MNCRILIALFLCCVQVFAQQRKNIEIIDSLLSTTMADLEKEIQPLRADTLCLVIEGDAAREYTYLAVRIGNYFKNAKYEVLRNSEPDISFDGLKLLIHDFRCTIEYSKPFTKKFLGRSFCKRNIMVILQGQVLRGISGQIVAPIDRLEKFQDEIYNDNLDSIESAEYPFTVGQRIGYSNWQSLLEPLVTIAVVTGIIYLFYIQRS